MQNRLIKFKSWNRHTKTINHNPLGYGFLNDSLNNELGEHTGTEYLQFTGMLDKNGREIYDGDKIKEISDLGNFEGVVEWSHDSVTWIIKGKNDVIALTPGKAKIALEIIGNIWK